MDTAYNNLMKIHSSYQAQVRKSLWALFFFTVILILSLLVAPLYEFKGIANYVPLHSFLELLSIIVSVMIFGTVWVRIANHAKTQNHLILACSFLGVAILDLLHVFSFPGMPDFITPSGSEKTINFWLMARYFSVSSLLLILVLSWQSTASRLRQWTILSCVLSIVFALAIIGLFYPSLIPSTYTEGQGLTTFKIVSEYCIASLYLIIGIRLLYLMRTTQPFDVVNLFVAVCLMAMSEIFFTLYFVMTDRFNLVGHIYKVIAYGFIYKSIFISILEKPYKELSESRKKLKDASERLKIAIDGTNDGLWLWDIESNKEWHAEQWIRLLGYDVNGEIKEEYSSWEERIHPDDKKRVLNALNQHLEHNVTYDCEQRLKTKQNEYKWFRNRGVAIRDKFGKPTRMGGSIRDISEQKKAEEQLQLAANVFTHARESIIITDATATIIDINDTFITTTGYSRDEAIGQNPRILQSGRQSAEFYTDMWETLLDEGYWAGEIWNRRKSGEVYAELKTISAVRDENGVATHYVALGSNITQIKEHQEQLERIAHFDILTQLPNRSLLADRLSQAMVQCSRHKRSLAVVFLDLDGFKQVNDTHGHDVGDELLVSLSVRMKEALREGDTLSRIGGDEFVAVLMDIASVEDCEPVLERLLQAASRPITIGEVILNISASIGVTLYPQDNVDADMLMRHADQAMYAAKESGKNCYDLFDIAQDGAFKVQRESLEALRTALDNQQFVLYYQPKVNMKTGIVTGVEALIRWQHPQRGLLNPIEFLPVIENHSMMIEMGEWVIDTALSQISQWQTMELSLPISTSINIAAVQLQQSDFTGRLTTLLAAHPDVAPHFLELEVLETSAIEDVDAVSTTMIACMALGVKFALDDFGTGYSSLTYLRRLPASLIKIDQSFVRDMLIDTDDLAIVEGVIALAKSFKRDVIAEGVETTEHGTALLQLGCELAQGYGIARPMPADDIPAWVGEWKPDNAWKV